MSDKSNKDMFDKEGLGTVLLSSVKDAQLGSRIRWAHFAKLTGEWPFVIYFLFFFIQQKNATKRNPPEEVNQVDEAEVAHH